MGNSNGTDVAKKVILLAEPEFRFIFLSFLHLGN